MMRLALALAPLMIAVALAGEPPTRVTMPGSPFGVAWGEIFGFPLMRPQNFMPKVRELGAGFTKVNLFWSQLEPEKGKYNWAALDPYLEQLQSPEEGVLALFSSSPWATRKPTWVFPPSPANNLDDYYQFVRQVVAHAKGRIRYYQNDSEPNNPLFWSGTKEEYVAQLRVFYKAVKDTDPQAMVVLGGCDGVFDPTGKHKIPGQEASLDFFSYILKEAPNSFDVFDLRLYADPYTIPARVEYIRQKMASFGAAKPIISTEYNGPGFFEFPANRRYFGLLQSWSQSVASGSPEKGPTNGIGALYEKIQTLPPETQMFLFGCSDQLEQKLQRLQARDLVIRNLLAFSAGVQKMAFWDLWHDTSKRDDITSLLYGKLKLAEQHGGTLQKFYPLAKPYQTMTHALAGIESIRRIPVEGRETIYLFEVLRTKRTPLYVVWDRRDTLNGEESPEVPFEWEWQGNEATATDALGHRIPVEIKSGHLSMSISVTPVFVDTKASG